MPTGDGHRMEGDTMAIWRNHTARVLALFILILGIDAETVGWCDPERKVNSVSHVK